ncbi:hypothetical protein O979_00150 [Mycobacterium avium subsp. paratuberculosis 10-4404]|nr:hypothetical protein O979_00150 [Mycobacterium avium subsp. paratuberculosis 10-4404]ETB08653.1 hypothetical protein O978_00200 [Mycobacterium avium subsp. paratuberculosis 10-5864]ETB15176.1 hypothetical protein O980_00235 [Mycobacterium avium subsp. paratuberculosis 08-8281]
MLVLASSIAVMAPGGEVFVPAAVIVGMLLAVAEQAWVRAAILPSAAGPRPQSLTYYHKLFHIR